MSILKNVKNEVQEDIVKIKGRVVKINDVIKNSSSIITAQVVTINSKTINLNEIVKNVLAQTKNKSKRGAKTLEKYSLLAVSEILIRAGSSTVDDDIIAAAISAAIVAYASAMTGGVGTLASTYLTSATVKPIVKKILYKLDAPEIKAGEALKLKANKMWSDLISLRVCVQFVRHLHAFFFKDSLKVV